MPFLRVHNRAFQNSDGMAEILKRARWTFSMKFFTFKFQCELVLTKPFQWTDFLQIECSSNRSEQTVYLHTGDDDITAALSKWPDFWQRDSLWRENESLKEIDLPRYKFICLPNLAPKCRIGRMLATSDVAHHRRTMMKAMWVTSCESAHHRTLGKCRCLWLPETGGTNYLSETIYSLDKCVIRLQNIHLDKF